MVSNRGFAWFTFLLMAAMLACMSQEITPTSTPAPIQTSGPTFTPLPLDPSRTLAPPETLAAGLTLTAIPADAETSLPTFTPIQPTLAATLTPSNTPQLGPTLRPTSTPLTAGTRTTATPATPVSGGLLSFSYEIDWRLSTDDPMEAIATVQIFASGGGGGYKYYRDGLEVAGSRFEYPWRACRGNPGTLTVTSADGQSVSQEYFSRPPCPTPTPSPTP